MPNHTSDDATDSLVSFARVDACAGDKWRLSHRHRCESEVAQFRLFAGMTIKEMAHELGVSERTVNQDRHFTRT